MITASSHALFCADCTMECMKYQIFVQKKNYMASVFFKVFIWMFEQDYIFFFTSIEEKKWLNHFLCKYFKKVVEANVHLICIMKLKLLLQLEITIKAQLNKMMVICLWKKYMYFFWNKSYIFDSVRSSHQSVRGSSGHSRPGPVSFQEAHTPKLQLQCSWPVRLSTSSRWFLQPANRVILYKINKSDFLEKRLMIMIKKFDDKNLSLITRLLKASEQNLSTYPTD